MQDHKKIIHLERPLKTAGGESVDSLTLDFDALTVSDFFTHDTLAKSIRDDRLKGTDDLRAASITATRGLDRASCVALGWLAAMHGDSRLSTQDLLQVFWLDAQEIEDAGRFFSLHVD